ncbi:hypothetical protein [Algoriphagus sp. NG3]|uniref:hypothetical protein n=1 Tax=Algoriphagus sp. NG3 TaxID=3097546 RepID=UPI002A839268|nr:hypothetical protein [Algoriphagus sp. NG3]WPR76463.1 hypothetical protein SLW71_03770 [Algoriphagus sp. NG3]
MKAIFTLLVLTILPLAGCTESENPDDVLSCQVETVAGPEDDVIGKWKMVWRKEINFSTGEKITDYSCNDIVFHFKPEGYLEVINDVEESEYSSGDYEYEFILSPFHETMEGYTLKINTLRWPCYINTNTLTLDASPVDGSTLHFVRME